MQTETKVVLKCIGCDKTPEELPDFKHNEEGMNPTEFVIEHERTLNRFEKDKFYCVTCYIKAGMPSTMMAVKFKRNYEVKGRK
jgi:hypothetical protein